MSNFGGIKFSPLGNVHAYAYRFCWNPLLLDWFAGYLRRWSNINYLRRNAFLFYCFQMSDKNVLFFFFFCLFQHYVVLISRQIQTSGLTQKGNMKETRKPHADDKFCGISRLKVQKYFSNFVWAEPQLLAFPVIQEELKSRMNEWTVCFFSYR